MEQQLQGLQQTMQGLQQTMQGVENRLEGVENRLEGVENRLEGVEGEVRKLGHRTSPRLRQALQHNAHSFTTTSQLAVVPHPDTGEEPEDFPATNGDLAQMPYAGLRRLLRFYGQPIIGTTDMLRQRLKAFIGQAP
ncbi:hypothetical protein COHA_005733 [Chlorella ohadii]|uniref:Uncharacterized protein n=1 Tax=Chlorella ohadii TaxID=2649997 RepID=A0AAD5DMK9_9CHLO|nr:hypothetical protein COHA_005733 [Chlorella ohadii]